MFKQYIISAFRNIGRNKLPSAINIFGLAIGLCTAILAMLYSYNELSYETCHKNADQISKVLTFGNFGAFSQLPNTFPQTAIDLPSEFPEIINAVCCKSADAIVFKDNAPITERHILFAETEFLKMFTYQFTQGKAYADFEEAICLSESMAKKYFGEENPIGKTLRLDVYGKQLVLNISGVFTDLPNNTHIKSDFLLSWPIAKSVFNDAEGYTSTDYSVYCEIAANCDRTKLNQEIAANFKMPTNIDDCTVALMPIKEFHLNSVFENNKANLYILFIGGLIALIICIFNYINQSTIQYTNRMQEVGVRLSNGGKARDIFKQFMTDTSVITFLSFVLALIMVKTTIPYFNSLVNMDLSLNINRTTIGLIILLFCTTVFLSGFYPSLIMSRLKPISLLRSSVNHSTGKSKIRNILSTVQFVFAILLIQVMIVTEKQGSYLANKDIVGFNSDNILVANGYKWGDLHQIKDELLRNTAILEVTWAQNMPAMQSSMTSSWKEPDNTQMANKFSCEEDFLKVFKIKMDEGRFFSNERKIDRSNSIVVNKLLVSTMGWENPIGQHLMVNNKTYTVIGVVGDYMAAPPILGTTPLIIKHADNSANNLIIRINPDNEKEARSYISKILKQANPNFPVTLSTYDEIAYDGAKTFYSTAWIINAFVVIIILNAFLSLFGLSYFIAERNKKQIGINKIFGATIYNIYWKLSKGFVVRFLIAFILVTPLSWLISKQYISIFSIQLPLTADIFIVSGILVLAMLLFSTGFKIISAANGNPVDSLRYE